MLAHIPEILDAGITSLKIEGRMKSSFYVATVVKAYREAIDSYLENPGKYVFRQEWQDEVSKVSHREYHTGFYFGEKNKQIYESSSYLRSYDIVGVVRKYDEVNKKAVIEQRNKVFEGDIVEILRPVGDGFEIKLNNMRNEEGNKINAAPVAQMIFTIDCPERLEENDLLLKDKGEN
jgi:putative protease